MVSPEAVEPRTKGCWVSAIAERVNYVTDQLHLTREEVAQIVGADARTVARWSAGQSQPHRSHRDRLLELHYVAEIASEVIHPDDVNLWMFAPNRMLSGDRPADRIADGHYHDVLALLEAMAEGVSF